MLKKQEALQPLLIALSSLGLMSLFKNLFQRDRPDHPLVNGITNYSFPSGHAMMSIAFYGLLIWLLGRHLRQHKIQRSLVTARRDDIHDQLVSCCRTTDAESTG